MPDQTSPSARMETASPLPTPAADLPESRTLRVFSEETHATEESLLHPALVHIPVLVAGAVWRYVARVGIPEEQRLTTGEEEQVIKAAQQRIWHHSHSEGLMLTMREIEKTVQRIVLGTEVLHLEARAAG